MATRKLVLAFLVLFSFSCVVDAAINPNPRYRVAPIKWNHTIIVEEPASTVFSLLITVLCFFTLLEYWNHHNKLRAQYVKYPFHWVWYGFLSLFTISFTWSTLFHLHETYLLERLDYLFAIISWGYQVFAAVIIIFRLTSKKAIFLAAIPFLLRVSFFVYWMLCVKFDYGYAVNVATQLVVFHAALWAPWGAWQVWQGRKYGYYIIFAHILTGFFVVFEIVDFIPFFRVFDGHSLWHLGHLLMIYCWIQFCKGHLDFHSSRQFFSDNK